MKATKYLVMAAAALAFAACSNEELASVAPKNKSGLKPLEFSTIVQKQTRAQIEASNLTTLYMTTTGTFYDANDAKVTDPTLTLTKDGDNWTYTYNDNTTPSDLFWPSEGTHATFKAWYYDGGSAAGALNNKSAEYDAVGAYAAVDYAGSGDQTVSLSTYHAVAKAEFKVKVLEKTQGNNSVKIDVKSVCLHNMNYKASAYTTPTSEAQMGAFTVDGTTHRDLITPIDANYTPSFITEGADAVTKGTMFVLPQTFEVQDLTAATWDKPYISVLAQICIDKASGDDPIIFPKYAGATDYAWIALPLPSDFTGMEAHKKYVFTINFRNDALGKVDRDQNPNGEDKNGSGEEPNETDEDDDEQPSGPDTNDKVPNGDEGGDVKLGNHSGYPLKVTVTTIDDFGEGGAYDVANVPSSTGGGGSSASVPEGALPGEFSIGSKKVYFSKGNLQATTTDGGNTWTWAFAENQWDYIGGRSQQNQGTETGNNYVNGIGTVSANGTVDLFCWVGASSSWEGAAMYGICKSDENLGNKENGYGTVATEALKSDWGNTMGSGWRTPTHDEWKYIFGVNSGDKRTGSTVGSTNNCCYTYATINTDNTGVNGVILFPDGETIANNAVTSWGAINDKNTSWEVCTKCTSDQWNALADKGCVFLPAAGKRQEGSYNSQVVNVTETHGYYWSSTPYYVNSCGAFYYGPNYQPIWNSENRWFAYSVRLVRDVE